VSGFIRPLQLEGIEREVEVGLGSLLVNRSKVECAASDNDVSSLIKGYFALLEITNKTIAAAKNMKEIGVVEIANKLISMNNGQ
jgi:hypothetical protein